MTTPAFTHTYTYSRLGVGDVIALDPIGEPYTVSVVVPSGWTANYWWSSDPLASVLDLSKWNPLALPTVLDPTARKLAVNILSTPGRLPESDRLKVTISSTVYKAATGHRYTDSGAHASNFNASAEAPPPGAPFNWYDFQDQGVLYSDTGLTTLINGTLDEVINGVRDKGLAGTEGDLDSNFGLATGPLFQPNVLGLGFSSAKFIEIDPDEGTGLITKAATLDYGNDEGMALMIGITHGLSDAGVSRMLDGPDGGGLAHYDFAHNDTQTRIFGSGGKTLQAWTHTLGTVWAAWAHNGPALAQAVSINHVAGTDANFYGFNAAPNSKISLGCRTNAQGFANAHILETVLWDKDAGILPTEAEMEAYATTRYGVTWA